MISCQIIVKTVTQGSLSLVRSLSHGHPGSIISCQIIVTWSLRVHYLLSDHCHSVNQGALSLVRSLSLRVHYLLSDHCHSGFIISCQIIVTQGSLSLVRSLSLRVHYLLSDHCHSVTQCPLFLVRSLSFYHKLHVYNIVCIICLI